MRQRWGGRIVCGAQACYGVRVKKKCGHLEVDTWHVATEEGREMMRLPAERRYGWREQLRAEMSGGVSRWMWPGLAGLVALGVLVGDWWLIIGAVGAVFFFLYQAVTLVRALGSGQVVTTTSRELTRVDVEGKEPLWCAVTRIDGRRHEVVMSCEQGIEALRAETLLEIAVLIDPADSGSNWLVGFREP